MTVMGLLTLVAILAVWFFRREWTQYVLGVTVAFPHTAALTTGIQGFPLFYFAVVVIAALSIPYLLMGLAQPGRVAAITSRRAFLPDLLGVLLVAWGAFIGIIGPRLFAGMRVFDAANGIDGQVGNMAVLAPTGQNLAQIGYLGFSALFLLLSGRLFRVDSRILGSALWVAVVLAAIRIVAEPVWPKELLQNMEVYYATPERLAGTFAEPSDLGMYLTAAGAYFAVMLWRSTGRRRIPYALGLVVVAIDFLFNASGTALLGLAVVVFAAIALGLRRLIVTSRFGVRPGAVVTFVAGVAAALTHLSMLYTITIASASAKTETSSWVNRGASNLRAWEIFVESLGAGIGLGSNRPSSFFFLVLSCLGIVGVGLLGVMVVMALRAGARLPAVTASAWAFAGIVIAASIAVPDLASPVFWIGLAACLCPWALARAEAVSDSPSAVDLTPALTPSALPPVRPPFGSQA